MKKFYITAWTKVQASFSFNFLPHRLPLQMHYSTWIFTNYEQLKMCGNWHHAAYFDKAQLLLNPQHSVKSSTFFVFEILATFCVKKKWLWYSAKSTVHQKQQVKIHISTFVSELSCFASHESIFLKGLLWVF